MISKTTLAALELQWQAGEVLFVGDTNEFHPLVDGKAYGAFSPVVILRVTYSNTHVDNAFTSSVNQSEQLVSRGFYAYVTANVDAHAQGVFFAQTILAHTQFRSTDFISWDIEEGGGDQAPRAQAFLAGVHLVLSDAMSQDFGYSGLSFWSTHLGNLTKDGVIVHKWVAAYGQGEPNAGQSLWQFTDKENMPGVQGLGDCSVFHGNLAQFLVLIHPQPTPAQEEDVPFIVTAVDNSVTPPRTYSALVDGGKKIYIHEGPSLQGYLAILKEAKITIGDYRAIPDSTPVS